MSSVSSDTGGGGAEGGLCTHTHTHLRLQFFQSSGGHSRWNSEDEGGSQVKKQWKIRVKEEDIYPKEEQEEERGGAGGTDCSLNVSE